MIGKRYNLIPHPTLITKRVMLNAVPEDWNNKSIE